MRYLYNVTKTTNQMTTAQQNHNHFQNTNRMIEFVQRNAKYANDVLKGDLNAEQKLNLLGTINESVRSTVAKWGEVIYQGPYTADDISVILLLENLESKKA